jgi:hypothetical protein
MRAPAQAAVVLDHTPSVRSRAAIASRAIWSAGRGFVVGAHRAKITFQPFRALAASATMLATAAGSTRSSEMRRSEPYSAASSRRSAGLFARATMQA